MIILSIFWALINACDGYFANISYMKFVFSEFHVKLHLTWNSIYACVLNTWWLFCQYSERNLKHVMVGYCYFSNVSERYITHVMAILPIFFWREWTQSGNFSAVIIVIWMGFTLPDSMIHLLTVVTGKVGEAITIHIRQLKWWWEEHRLLSYRPSSYRPLSYRPLSYRPLS